jgi:hypothetical protein
LIRCPLTTAAARRSRFLPQNGVVGLASRGALESRGRVARWLLDQQCGLRARVLPRRESPGQPQRRHRVSCGVACPHSCRHRVRRDRRSRFAIREGDGFNGAGASRPHAMRRAHSPLAGPRGSLRGAPPVRFLPDPATQQSAEFGHLPADMFVLAVIQPVPLVCQTKVKAKLVEPGVTFQQALLACLASGLAGAEQQFLEIQCAVQLRRRR